MIKNYKILLLFLFSILLSSVCFSDVENLFPTEDGNTNTLTAVGCANNYQCMDENPPDDDTTYLHTTAVQSYQFDLFQIQDHAGGVFDTINSVTIRYRVRCESSGGSVCRFRSYIRTESTNYQGAEKLSGGSSWTNYTEVYNTNPNTGLAWTVAQIDALESGIGLNGFLNSDGNRARGTQVFVQVDYTPAVQPVITFVDPTPNNDTFINVNYTYVNITTSVTSDVVLLEWNGTNMTMSGSGTNFFLNVTDLSNCSDYTYKVYANSTGSGLWGVSEERLVKISVYAPAINWKNPQTNGLTYYNDFNINATILNCNLSDVNITIYDFDNNPFYFKQILGIDQPSYDVYELTNFTQLQEPIKINRIEICADNEAGLVGCSNRTFIYDSLFASPQHSSKIVGDFTFSSLTYITILNETFNQSVINNATFRSSFYTEKLDVPGQDTDIYVKYIFNGVELCDEPVVTLFNRNIFRSATTCISEGETIVGENNLVIQIRRTNNGLVSVYNWDLHFENGQTNLLSDFRRDVNLANGSITSSTFQPVLNFTTEKRTNSTTTIDYSMTITSVDPATIECFGSNGLQNGTGIIRTTTLPLETMSIGGAFTTTIPQTVSETWTLYCKQDVSTSTIDIEAYTQDNKDDNNRTMNVEYQTNTSINSTNPLTLTAGKHKIGEIVNYEVLGSHGIDIITSVNVEAITTIQDVNISLEITKNGDSYQTSHLRTLTDIGEDASIKFYGEFGNLSVGDFANISLYAVVDTGESINILSENINARDVSDLDVVTSNIAPLVLINYPINGQTVWYNNQPFNISILDFNNNLDTCNVTLNDTILASGFTDDTFVNYTSFAYGNYTMKLSCNDSFSDFGEDSISVTLSCTENWIPQVSQCTPSFTQILTYTDTNVCTTNTTLPSNNGTVLNCIYQSLEITNNYNITDFVLGEDLSIFEFLYEINTTKAVTNAICSINTYAVDNSTKLTLLDTQKIITQSGIISYTTNSDEWQKRTDYNLLTSDFKTEVDCYCREDCTDTEKEGCCISFNGSLITQTKYAFSEYEFEAVGDKTYSTNKFVYYNAYIVLFFMLLILGYLYFAVNDNIPLKALLYFGILFMGAVPVYIFNKLAVQANSPNWISFGISLFNIYYIFLFVILTYFIAVYAIRAIRNLSSSNKKDDDFDDL